MNRDAQDMGLSSDDQKYDPIKPWFDAIDAVGDYTVIRFGRLKPDSTEVEWVTMSHSDCDGIGGFGKLLRERGYPVAELPKNDHIGKPSWGPFLRSIPKLLGPRRKLKWKNLERKDFGRDHPLPDPVLAWHVFSEVETKGLLEAARAEGVTLNSFLLKNLDGALREDQIDPAAAVPWMVPVNLRGQVERHPDTQNHTSYLSVKVGAGETVQDLHREIFRKLDLGEHWANWKAYSATRLVPAVVKRALYRTGRAMAEWNLGLLTNMGVWDAEKKIDREDLVGSWMIGAPVLRCQMVGAGLLTFQGRLSMTLQVHPDLTTSQEVPERWMKCWVDAVMETAREAKIV